MLTSNILYLHLTPPQGAFYVMQPHPHAQAEGVSTPDHLWGGGAVAVDVVAYCLVQ